MNEERFISATQKNSTITATLGLRGVDGDKT
jgi:hypothetical protein